MVVEAELRRADPHLKAITDRNHPEEARIAGSAANEVSVEESAVNAKANAVVVPPVRANRKNTLESPLAKLLANGLFLVSRLDPFPSWEKLVEGRMRGHPHQASDNRETTQQKPANQSPCYLNSTSHSSSPPGEEDILVYDFVIKFVLFAWLSA